MFNAGVRGKRAKDSTGLITVGEHFNQQNFLVPTVTRFAVTDGSYVDTNDTAADPAGNQVIVLYGSGFAPGATVLVGSTTIGAVTFLDSGRLTFSSPALGSGSYTVFVTNANGGTGILVPGLVYSGLPTFTTAAGSLGSVYETTAINTTVVATGDAPITYALSSGSLPSGSTLSSGGTISGTAPVDGSSTTYSFTVQASDAQLQDTVRSFSLTINTDVVSFSSPANNTTTSATQNTAISNVTVVATSAAGYGVLYTSSGLPTGLSMNTSTGIISGTPTILASNTSIITATANTTSKTAALYLNWTINLPGDLFWKYASLLMSASTVPNGNTFNTDLSTFNNEIVVVADTKPSEFHPFKEGYYSNYFDGTGDALRIAPSTILDLGPGDFTIEFWMNTPSWSSGTAALLGKKLSDATSGWVLYRDSGSATKINARFGAQNNFFTTSAVGINVWEHWALVRTGTTLYWFKNGVLDATGSSSLNVSDTSASFNLGFADTWNVYNTFYISNLRIVKGTALYTSSFTPSRVPLTYVANTVLLTCQSNKLIDNSNNNFTIVKVGDTTVNPFSPFNGTPTTITVPDANNYSVYFDGTGDYLRVDAALNTITSLTQSWTLECWVYPLAAGISTAASDDYFIGLNTISGGDNELLIGMQNVYVNGTPYNNTVISTRQWTHVAAVYSGSSLKFYINGVLSNTFNETVGPLNICVFGIGAEFDGSSGATPGNYYTGYVSNLRLVANTELYTSNFTPPTQPLTAIANTRLLTCQANALIDNSANAYTITAYGNAGPARNGPFANTTTVTLIGNEGSAYFDGTGDYLDTPSANTSSIYAFGTSDYTLEAWIYPTATTAGMRVFEFSGNQDQIGINQTSTGTIDYYNGTTSTTSAAGLVTVNSWTHIALVRQSGTAKVYVNGALAVTQASTPNTTARTLWIGGRNNTVFQGYMSNVRVTKGTALYTTPFVPSWAPLTPVANTVLLTAQTNLSSNTKVFVDESNFNNIITGTGNATLGSFSPFGSTWSGYFDGTTDYLTTTASASNQMTGDFTVELWAYQTVAAAASGLVGINNATSSGSANFGLYLDVNGRIIFWVAGNATTYTSTNIVITPGAWYHVAFVRSGSTNTVYVNGVSVLTNSATPSWSGSPVITVGRLFGDNTGATFYGYISNVRILKGTAIYTSAFTPSTNPLVSVANTVFLSCNSNRFVDYSVANNVITRTGDASVSKFSPFSSLPVTPASYSGYFDGTGDYLVSANNTAFALGTGDFTFECWIYPTAWNASLGTIIDFRMPTGVSNQVRPSLRVTDNSASDNLGYLSFATGPGAQIYSYLPTINRWYHLAVVRLSGSTKLYVDGQQAGSTYTDTNDYGSSTQEVVIGQAGYERASTSTYFSGYISNVRIIKGTAIYTANNTPSTTPLTAVANTSLLTCQSTTFVDNSNNSFAIAVNGDAKPVTQNPFTDTVGAAINYSANTYGSSIYFDSFVAASGDFLSVSGIPIAATGQFTFEAWIYTDTVNSADAQMIYSQYTTSDANRWTINISTANKIAVVNPTLSVTGATTIVPNQWNHVAVTRDSSNTLRIFLNGVVDATSASYTYSIMQSPPRVGYYNNTPNDYFNGYMSSVRVVSGQALYTTPFVPSNQPAPVTANTTLLLASTVGPSVTNAIRNTNIETAGTARYVANNSPYYDTYSGYFDGTGDYLTFGANQANLGLGTGDFTFEFWFNAATIPSGEIDIFESQTNNSLRVLKRASSSGLSFDPYGGSATLIMADASITTNTWHHVAISRTSGTTSAYYDGTRVVNQADSTNYATPTVNYGVGGRASGANYFNGYISNMRLVKGTGLYSGTTITVPTGPLTAVTNTQLLICNTNRFIDSSTNAFTITKVGDVRITALQPFAANNTSRFSSVYFPVKTDYLSVSTSYSGGKTQANLTTFPGDFTFECWVYPTDTTISTTWGIWDARNAGASAAAMVFNLSALASPVTGSWRISYYNGTSYYGTGIVLYNQWSHVAWVRSGTTMTFYVNGVAGGTATISGTQTAAVSSSNIYIGSKDNGLANYGTVGYIADLRITNGYARTITVPTAPYDIK